MSNLKEEILREFDEKIGYESIIGRNEQIKSFLSSKLDEIEKEIMELLPEDKEFLWLASNDDTGEERILDKDGYFKLNHEEGYKWSGHTIQTGYNSAIRTIRERITKYFL